MRQYGITIDRPHGSPHPRYPEILYPIDYGFVNDTLSSDGEELDIFVGSTDVGLVGVIWCQDHVRRDREAKLLWNCHPRELYLVNGFINFNREMLEGVMVLRHPMRSLWGRIGDKDTARS